MSYTQAGISQEINQQIITNSAGQVTAAVLRQVLQDMNAAMFTSTLIAPILVPLSIVPPFTSTILGKSQNTNTSQACYFNINVNIDSNNFSSYGSYLANLAFGFGGSSLQGARIALNAYAFYDGQGPSSNASPYYGAVQSVVEAFSHDTASSALVATTSYCLLNTGAGAWYSIEGEEISAGGVAGTSVSYRVALDVVSIGAIQGSTMDYAIAIGTLGTVAFKDGLVFSNFNDPGGIFPTSGTLILADFAGTATTGIDFSLLTLTTFLKGPNSSFTVDGSGNVVANQISISGPATGGSNITISNNDGIHNAEIIFDTSGLARWEIGKDGLGNFFYYDDTGHRNVLSCVPNGMMTINPVGGLEVQTNMGIGVAYSAAAVLGLAAGTTAQSQINFASSTAPTSPNNGDFWFDGTNLNICISGSTKTLTHS